MTTSINQRRIKMTPNNPVRRRLNFGETVDDQAKKDNFANVLQESIARDVKEKSEKWNFDFKKEKALKGCYEWYCKEGDEWVLMKPIDGEYSPRRDNENTPLHDNSNIVPNVRKRRNNMKRNVPESVKRRVKFD